MGGRAGIAGKTSASALVALYRFGFKPMQITVGTVCGGNVFWDGWPG